MFFFKSLHLDRRALSQSCMLILSRAKESAKVRSFFMIDFLNSGWYTGSPFWKAALACSSRYVRLKGDLLYC